MEKNELQKKIYSKIDELPTLPAVLPRLLSLIEDEKTSARHIADAISSDPALTSKILKVANSAYYGFSQEISSLERAIPLLGFNMVRSLALSIGIIDTLPSGKRSPYFSPKNLWIHGLAVATVMGELGKKFGADSKNEHYFVVGLLHDIGKIVFDLFFTELFQQALEKAHSKENEALYTAERSVIGFDHGEVGSMLLTRWKFPDVISAPIAFHHRSEFPEDLFAGDVAMLRIADVLPQELGLGAGGNPFPPDINEADLAILNMSEKELEDTRAYLDSARDGIYELFSAMN